MRCKASTACLPQLLGTARHKESDGLLQPLILRHGHGAAQELRVEAALARDVEVVAVYQGEDGLHDASSMTGEAQRRRLMALRDEGTIGDAAFQRIEEEPDRAEL